MRDYLASRNIAVFSIDVDFSDWRTQSPTRIVDNVMKGLQHTGGGIILFHDIHEQTAKALPTVLEQLKVQGYKVVHLVPKTHVEAIAIAEPEKSESQRQARLFRSRRRRRQPIELRPPRWLV